MPRKPRRIAQADTALLVEAYDAMLDEEYERALDLVRRHREANPTDEEADWIEELILDVQKGETPPLWDAHAAGRLQEEDQPAELAFACLRCGNPTWSWRDVLINTRGVTFFGYDALNARARCIGCTTCGHIHWFVHGWPATWQRTTSLRDRVQDRQEDQGVPGGCLVCGYGKFVTRQALLNTRFLTFLGLDWMNKGATMISCLRCGYSHWYRKPPKGPPATNGRLPPDPPLTKKDLSSISVPCLACGRDEFTMRQGLLNDRVMTFLRLDWLDEGARLRVCESCGGVEWYADGTGLRLY